MVVSIKLAIKLKQPITLTLYVKEQILDAQLKQTIKDVWLLLLTAVLTLYQINVILQVLKKLVFGLQQILETLVNKCLV